ncbi:MAG: hypothetical protein PHY93_21470 [Bacteriovorax sp.]|nr:hypothetical protein [Bacteriovorax sp.]
MKKHVKIVVVLLALVATLQAVMSYAGTTTPEQELKDKMLEFVKEEKIRLESENHDELEKNQANAILSKLEAIALDKVSTHDGDPGP